ncbi:MAG: hypothetical protein ACI9FJ_001474 [Alteromonadaceae bacterium]|jgi:hypothetical protein
MLRLLFLLPLMLCFLWFGYLSVNNWTMAQGKQGFIYILTFSGVIALFYTLMLYLTNL